MKRSFKIKMIDLKNLVKGMRNLKEVVQEGGSIFIMLIIFALIVGAIVYQTGSNGSLPVSNSTQANIDGLESSFDTQITDNATEAAGFANEFIIVGIILLLFGGFLFAKGKGKKGGSLS